MPRYSERSDPKVKPRFPRLQLMALRRREVDREALQKEEGEWPNEAHTVHESHR